MRMTAHELFPVVVLELAAFVGLAGKGFDDPNAGQVLLECGGDNGILLLVRLIDLGQPPEEEQRRDHDQRDSHDREQPQPHIEKQDNSQVDREQEDNATGLDGLVGEQAAHRLNIGGGALDQLAGRGVVMVGEGEALDVVEKLVAQAQDDPLRGAGRQSPAEEGEPPL
jgi:hypothetical protein